MERVEQTDSPKGEKSGIQNENRWSDPSGRCYVAEFNDEAEERAWVEYAETRKERKAA